MARKSVVRKSKSVKSKVKRTKRPVSSKRKKPVKARVKKAAVKKSPVDDLEKIGEVTHFFPHVNAAAIKILKGTLAVGDEIYIKGHTSDFKEKVESMQLDHVAITEGKKGNEIGLLVKSRVRIGDSVYKI